MYYECSVVSWENRRLFAYSTASRWLWALLSWLHHTCCRFFHRQKLCFINTCTLAPAGGSPRTRALENTTSALQKSCMQFIQSCFFLSGFRCIGFILRLWRSNSKLVLVLRHPRWARDETANNGDLTSEAVLHCTSNLQKQGYTDTAFLWDRLVGTHRRCLASGSRWFMVLYRV